MNELRNARRWRKVLLPLLLSRLWVGFFVYLGHGQRTFLEEVPGGWQGVSNWWLNPWTTYDSLHFTRIAQHGYEPLTTAFFPLYPMLLRLAGRDEVAIAIWGIVLSNLALIAAAWLFFRLTETDYDGRVAEIGVWLLAFYPTAAYWSAVYTESIFLVWILGCFLCVRHNRWAAAGMLGLAAALTKNSGVLVCAALCFEWWRARQSPNTHAAHRLDQNSPHKDDAPKVVPGATALGFAFLPLMGFWAVQGYFAKTFGLLAGIESQRAYYREWMWPWLPIWRDIVDLSSGRAGDLVTVLNLLVTIVVPVLIVKHWKRQPPSYSLLMLGILLMHLGYGHTKPPYTIDAVRYFSTTFPWVQLLAWYAATRLNTRFKVLYALIVLLLLCAAYSFLFGVKAFTG